MDGSFSYYVSDGAYHLKYARGRPSLTGREFHNYDEIVLFLEGDAQFLSKSIQLTLKPGSLVLIPREQFHQFAVADTARYTRCILGFRPTTALQPLVRQVMGEITVIPEPSDRIVQILRQLMEACERAIPEQELLLMLPAALTLLLSEQKQSRTPRIRELVTVSAITRRAMDYIDGSLPQPLTLNTVAQALNVSASTLSHRFKEDMNISVYRYIVKKRLSVACGYMEQGLSLHTAAALSGFADYASFFRLYKKYYGCSPKQWIKQH